jgi:hypothetical protein
LCAVGKKIDNKKTQSTVLPQAMHHVEVVAA